MSLRRLVGRLPRHVWRVLAGGGARGARKILGAKAPAPARWALVDPRGALPPLGRRLLARFFYGDSVPRFALIGLTLSTGGTLLSKEDKEEILCYEIRDIASKYQRRLDIINPNDSIEKGEIFFKDLEVGSFLAKGCSAVVYSAKIKGEVETENKYPLALKIMFNYDIQSCSMAILNAMYKETIPAQLNRIREQLPFWASIFQKDKVELPPHPNIVATYNVFADYMPNLTGSMELYPDALPAALNPEGSGRNMTMFLLMKRYQHTLKEYLELNEYHTQHSMLLLAQLLEGIIHLSRHGIAHRDLKSDNLLVDEVLIGQNRPTPQLVITDFGCCLADVQYGLRVPYKSDAVDKGGNISLMAPEIILQQPGFFSILDYSKSDTWAAGAIAYEIFGHLNPFVEGRKLSNVSYDESELPDMKKDVPPLIRRLVRCMLIRNPDRRPGPELAANVCHLYLWAPKAWITSSKMPSTKEILEWLMCLTTKIICEARLFDRYLEDKMRSISPEYVLISSFLSRVQLSQVRDSLNWIHGNSN